MQLNVLSRCLTVQFIWNQWINRHRHIGYLVSDSYVLLMINKECGIACGWYFYPLASKSFFGGKIGYFDNPSTSVLLWDTHSDFLWLASLDPRSKSPFMGSLLFSYICSLVISHQPLCNWISSLFFSHIKHMETFYLHFHSSWNFFKCIPLKYFIIF